MMKEDPFYIRLDVIRDFSRRFNVSYKEAIEILYCHFNQIKYKTDIHPQEVYKTVYKDEDQGTCFLIGSIVY